MQKSRHVILAAIILILSASCATPRQIKYLQDMNASSQIELENKFEAVISPYDELDIVVSCFDPELAKPFNMGTFRGGASSGGVGNNAYLVDVYGNIQFPILGEIHVAGMTRLNLQEHITQLLKEGNYISDPFVMVRFHNFKIFFLSPEGGKSITVPNERCTFLEALAMSGGLDKFSRRNRIGVMREVNGKMTMRYLDPRSSEVFNDPYFMLQQNDFIITESHSSKYYRDELYYWFSWFSLASTVSSIFTLYLVYKRT